MWDTPAVLIPPGRRQDDTLKYHMIFEMLSIFNAVY